MVFYVCAFFIGLFFVIYSKFNKNKDLTDFYSNILQKSWQIFIKLISAAKIIKVKVENLNKLQSIQSSIIVANHLSFIDVVILISIIPKTTCFVAKKAAENFLFKNIIKSIFLPSGLEISDLKTKTKSMLDKGYNVLIFPSGTRHKISEKPKLKKGAALIAINAHKDIVPVKINIDREFLQAGVSIYKYASSEDIANYNISICPVINTSEYINKYTDEVELKTVLTHKISDALFS